MKILFIPFCNCCSVAKSWLTLWNPMDCSTPGFSVLHYLLEFAQNHVHWVSDAIQTSHPLLHPFPLAFSLSQNQGLFRWAEFLYQVAKVTVYYSISWMYWVSFSLLLLQIISQWIHWTYAIFAFFPQYVFGIVSGKCDWFMYAHLILLDWDKFLSIGAMPFSIPITNVWKVKPLCISPYSQCRSNW